MLTLNLTLDNEQVTVCANEAQSHSFSLQDLRLNDAELKAFVLNPRVYGSRLFQSLFKDGSAAKTVFDELSKQTAQTIVLVLDSPVLDSVAWEYAYNEVKQEYVVEDFTFMRTLPENERPANGRLKESVESVSLLFIPANPLVDLNAEPMRALDVDGEWREMTRHIMASNAPFDLLQLRPATPEQLQTSMARFRDGLAVHFSGHGAAMKDGTILLFERENGASNPLGAHEFIRAVKDKAGIVFLSACQSAATEKTEFGNLARGLVKSGVPFALGMQFNLPDPFAPIISGQFYNWLAQGHAIPEATMQARRAVKRENEFFVGMIALYAAHPDETGELNWRGSGASLAQTFRPADVSDLPSPASGLIGRQHELMRIGTQLIEAKKPLTVTLHGAGGIGKTALLWQSLLRFAPSFDLTLALALDPLPSLESILGRIERFLGLPSPSANETKERETLVRERLTSKRTLLGLDNFETLNYALNEKDSDKEKTSKSLHAFFRSLAANGVTLCVTSREVTNLPGETIEDIQGLTNENGGRLFQENVVRQKDEIYIEKTQQVSEMVGGHPLALRLLASAFDDQVGTSLGQYIEELQSHLPKARDKWTEEDRHESLRASFDFTMNNLIKMDEGKDVQIALSRISVFVSYFRPEVIVPTVIGDWMGNWKISQDDPKLKVVQQEIQTLWSRGLLERLEVMTQDGIFYLYRLHPALSTFASETISPKELLVLQETHWKAMVDLANRAYPSREGGLFQSPILAAIMRNALPDLMKAAKFNGPPKTTVILLNYLSTFNLIFGELDAAMEYCIQSIELAKRIDDPQGETSAFLTMAQIYKMRGQLDEAIALYDKLLDRNKGSDNERDNISVFHDLGQIYVTRGDLSRAQHYFQRALTITENVEDLSLRASLLNDMAEIHLQHGDLTKSLQLHKESLAIHEKTGNLQGQAANLAWLGNIEHLRKNDGDAMSYLGKALQLAKSIEFLAVQASALSQMASIYHDRGDLDTAVSLDEQVLDMQDKLGDQLGKADTIGNLAIIYTENDELDKAFEMNKQSLRIYEKLGDLASTARALHNIAGIFLKRNQLQEAMELCQESIALKEKIGNEILKPDTLVLMAEISNIQEDFSSAIKFYKQALEIYERMGNNRFRLNVLLLIANVCKISKKFDEAINFYNLTLEIYKKSGDFRGEISSIYNMAVVRYESKNFIQAIELFQQVANMCNEEDVELKASCFNNMGVIYFTLEQDELSIKNLSKALLIHQEAGNHQAAQGILSSLSKVMYGIGSREFVRIWNKETGYALPIQLTDLIEEVDAADAAYYQAKKDNKTTNNDNNRS